MIKRVKLEDLAKKMYNKKSRFYQVFEIEAVPVVVRKKSDSIKSIFKPKWTAVIQSGNSTMIAKHARFGSTFFHVYSDLLMLMYACEKRIPVKFRGSISKESRGSFFSSSDIPVFKVGDYKINNYATAGWKS